MAQHQARNLAAMLHWSSKLLQRLVLMGYLL